MSIKGVTKSVENKDIDILKYLTQYLTIKQIANLRKSSRTVVYRSINRLIDKGFIRKIGKSYDVTELGLQTLHKSLSGLIRLHNLAFKITLINKPHNWELRKSKIIDCRAFMKEIELSNNQKQELYSFSNIKVKTTNNSIIFYMPMFYGKDTDDCFKQAIDSLFNLIPKIENLFKITLIKDRKCNIEIISQHYAKLQDSIAKIYHAKDNKLYVKDDLGNLRIIADYSFRVDELEAVYNISAKEDMDVMQNFIKELLKNPVTTNQLMSMIQQVTANQMIYAKNQETHIGLYKVLSKEIRGLSKEIRYFKKSESKKIKKDLKEGYQKSIFDY